MGKWIRVEEEREKGVFRWLVGVYLISCGEILVGGWGW